ncbi:MAG: hypothetical protein M3Q15_04620 [Pseudomonadota bacterium]|nr:hypothetical protein [Pseudomonadota bacterium]
MATAVSIASNALIRLGTDPISSFDEADLSGSNIERARVAVNLWPTIRRQVLRSYTPNIATKRVLLSASTTAPAFGYAYQYQKPSDWLRTVQVGREEYDREDWRAEGNYFLSASDEFALTYIYDNENPAMYDPSLVAALEVAMAAAMAYPITKSTSLAESMAAEARDHLRMARGLDAQDDSPATFGDFRLLGSRFGSRW